MRSQDASSPINWSNLAPWLIVAAGTLVYLNSLTAPLLFDAWDSIIYNENIRSLWPFWEPFRSSGQHTLSGRPITSWTFALNYALGGFSPISYHALNILIHLAAGLFLYGILHRTFTGKGFPSRYRASAKGLALAITVLWVVHPLHTGVITYLVHRTEAFMGLFYLTTLYGVIRSVNSRRPRAWEWLAVGACLLGMGSKEVMVTAPIVVLAYDRIFLARSFREIRRKRGGLYLGLAATWIFLLALVTSGPRTDTAGWTSGLTVMEYARTQPEIILHYLRLTLWPQPLVLHYGWTVAADVWLAGMVLAALVAASAWALRNRPALGFLGLWFFLILAPSSSVVPVATELASERRVYLSSIALMVLLVFVGEALLRRLLPRSKHMALTHSLGAVIVLIASVQLGMLTIQRNQDYLSPIGLWQDTVEKRPHNALAWSNSAAALARAGRPEEADAHYQRALLLDPRRKRARYYRALVLAQMGRLDEAMDELREVARRSPGFVPRDGGRILRWIERGEDEAALRVLKWVTRGEDL